MSEKVKIQLTNDYHQTAVNVIVDRDGDMSASQVRRVKRTLCPGRVCQCSGDLGTRGSQAYLVDTWIDSHYRVRATIQLDSGAQLLPPDTPNPGERS